MKKHTKCRMNEICRKPHRDGECERNCYYNTRKVMTNYDRLISKSPEEMAEFIGDDPMHDICPNNCHEDLDRPCKVCALEWLKQEATE